MICALDLGDHAFVIDPNNGNVLFEDISVIQASRKFADRFHPRPESFKRYACSFRLAGILPGFSLIPNWYRRVKISEVFPPGQSLPVIRSNV